MLLPMRAHAGRQRRDVRGFGRIVRRRSAVPARSASCAARCQPGPAPRHWWCRNTAETAAARRCAARRRRAVRQDPARRPAWNRACPVPPPRPCPVAAQASARNASRSAVRIQQQRRTALGPHAPVLRQHARRAQRQDDAVENPAPDDARHFDGAPVAQQAPQETAHATRSQRVGRAGIHQQHAGLVRAFVPILWRWRVLSTCIRRACALIRSVGARRWRARNASVRSRASFRRRRIVRRALVAVEAMVRRRRRGSRHPDRQRGSSRWPRAEWSCRDRRSDTAPARACADAGCRRCACRSSPPPHAPAARRPRDAQDCRPSNSQSPPTGPACFTTLMQAAISEQQSSPSAPAARSRVQPVTSSGV